MEGDCALEQVGRNPGQLAAVRGEDRATGCRGAPSRHRLANAETIERPHRIREESDSGANRVNARRPLQHDGLIARPAQGDRSTQSSDPSPDDDHAHRVIIRRRDRERKLVDALAGAGREHPHTGELEHLPVGPVPGRNARRSRPSRTCGRYALVRAIEEGLTLKAAAIAFSVSPATAHRWWHRWLEAGEEARATLSCL